MNTMTEELVAQLDDELKLGLTRQLYRSSFAVGVESIGEAPIDRESMTIRGVAIATEGPALGHGLDLDQTFLDQVVEAGNASKHGIKARFDHPNASSTSMGTAVGRFRAFRKTGSVVRADLHLLKSAKKSPNGDLPDYLMELAHEDPQSFGTSVVFSGGQELRLNPDGTRQTGVDGEYLPALARLEKLHAADVVDEPAANPDGLFHALSENGLAGKITTFLDRYFDHKGLTVGTIPPEPPLPITKEIAMSEDKKPTELDAQSMLKAAKAKMLNIFKYGRKLGIPEDKLEVIVSGDAPLDQVLMDAIDDAETRQFFNQKTALSLIETAPNPSAGGPADPGAVTIGVAEKPKTDADVESMTEEERTEHWRGVFAASPELKAEFMDFDIFYAFKQNEHRSRILRGAAERE